jgi:hypothetical protein
LFVPPLTGTQTNQQNDDCAFLFPAIPAKNNAKEDPTKFVLVEVYQDADRAPAAHKETAHYLEWRDTVADMMAAPRQARKFTNLFPTTEVGWKYPENDPSATLE